MLSIDGFEPRAFVEKFGVAYVPELIALPTHWTHRERVAPPRDARGRPERPPRRRGGDRVIEALAIGEQRTKKLKTLSKDNFQRVGLAQALLMETRVAIFDEPTHGLDPVWTQKVPRDRFVAQARRSRNHHHAGNLDELERGLPIASRQAHPARGDREIGAPVTALMAYRVRVVAGGDALAASRAWWPVRAATSTFRPWMCRRSTPGLAAAIGNGALISAVIPRESALEQAFHSAVGADFMNTRLLRYARYQVVRFVVHRLTLPLILLAFAAGPTYLMMKEHTAGGSITPGDEPSRSRCSHSRSCSSFRSAHSSAPSA